MNNENVERSLFLVQLYSSHTTCGKYNSKTNVWFENKNLFQSVLQKQRNKHNIEQATKTSNHYQKNNTKRFGNVFWT